MKGILNREHRKRKLTEEVQKREKEKAEFCAHEEIIRNQERIRTLSCSVLENIRKKLRLARAEKRRYGSFDYGLHYL